MPESHFPARFELLREVGDTPSYFRLSRTSASDVFERPTAIKYLYMCTSPNAEGHDLMALFNGLRKAPTPIHVVLGLCLEIKTEYPGPVMQCNLTNCIQLRHTKFTTPITSCSNFLLPFKPTDHPVWTPKDDFYLDTGDETTEEDEKPWAVQVAASKLKSARS